MDSGLECLLWKDEKFYQNVVQRVDKSSLLRMVKKINSIKKRDDFLKLRSIGKKITSKFFIIYFKKQTYKNINLGITVSKKHGNAVNRNYIKRIIKAAFIKNLNQIPEKLEIEIIPKINKGKLKFKEIETDFLGVFNILK